MNTFLASIAPHPSKRISDAVRGNSAILDLTVGVSDFGPPPKFAEEMIAMLSYSNERTRDIHVYADSRGHADLRRAIVRRYRARYGMEFDADTQVLVTHGGAEAIWLTVFALTNLGDAVLIPDPSYMLYAPIVKTLGRKPILLPTSASEGFILQPDVLLAKAVAKPKLLLFNSPCNPTGAVYSRPALETISSIARQMKLYVMHDEVFDDVIFADNHLPLSQVDPNCDNIILINSISKRYGMSGWRLGWLIAAPEIISAAAKSHTYQTLAVGTLLQRAVAAVLDDQNSDQYVREQITNLKDKVHDFIPRLSRIPGISLPSAVKGGFYLLPEVTGLARRLNLRAEPNQTIGELVADYLLHECNKLPLCRVRLLVRRARIIFEFLLPVRPIAY